MSQSDAATTSPDGSFEGGLIHLNVSLPEGESPSRQGPVVAEELVRSDDCVRSEEFTEETVCLNADVAKLCTELHVLAVDDSVPDRKIVERLLKLQSYKVTTAKNAIHALQILGIGDNLDDNGNEKKTFDLIITDYSMPGMNGYEFLRKIKDAASLREIPVVMMSSEDVSSRRKRCLDEGAEEFLLKPLCLNDILKIKCFLKKSEPFAICSKSPSTHSISQHSLSADIVITGSKEEKQMQTSVQDNLVQVSDGCAPSATAGFNAIIGLKGTKRSISEFEELIHSTRKYKLAKRMSI